MYVQKARAKYREVRNTQEGQTQSWGIKEGFQEEVTLKPKNE